MTDLQLELTRLIGRKELTFGCIVYIPETKIYSRRLKEWFWRVHFANALTEYMWVCLDNKNYIPWFNAKKRNVEIIGHPATLSDLHKWMNDSTFNWFQSNRKLTLQWSQKKWSWFIDLETSIVYDSSIGLLDQSESTLQAIINLIKEHA